MAHVRCLRCSVTPLLGTVTSTAPILSFQSKSPPEEGNGTDSEPEHPACFAHASLMRKMGLFCLLAETVNGIDCIYGFYSASTTILMCYLI
jgi:hypothetical protein